jgi:hypothetical protein
MHCLPHMHWLLYVLAAYASASEKGFLYSVGQKKFLSHGNSEISLIENGTMPKMFEMSVLDNAETTSYLLYPVPRDDDKVFDLAWGFYHYVYLYKRHGEWNQQVKFVYLPGNLMKIIVSTYCIEARDGETKLHRGYCNTTDNKENQLFRWIPSNKGSKVREFVGAGYEESTDHPHTDGYYPEEESDGYRGRDYDSDLFEDHTSSEDAGDHKEEPPRERGGTEYPEHPLTDYPEHPHEPPHKRPYKRPYEPPREEPGGWRSDHDFSYSSDDFDLEHAPPRKRHGYSRSFPESVSEHYDDSSYEHQRHVEEWEGAEKSGSAGTGGEGSASDKPCRTSECHAQKDRCNEPLIELSDLVNNSPLKSLCGNGDGTTLHDNRHRANAASSCNKLADRIEREICEINATSMKFGKVAAVPIRTANT